MDIVSSYYHLRHHVTDLHLAIVQNALLTLTEMRMDSVFALKTGLESVAMSTQENVILVVMAAMDLPTLTVKSV